MTPEGRALNAICDYLAWFHKDITFWRNESVGIYDAKKKTWLKRRSKYHLKGTSDILGILPGGQFLAIEVKRADGSGKVSPEQLDFVAMVNRRGGLAFFAKAVHEVKDKLEAWRNQNTAAKT